MNFSSILIVTYGRSGSTLLQGLVNSIDGCLIRGENYNFCYGLYKSYESLMDTINQFGNKSKSLEVTSPWYGAPLLNENTFLEDARKLVLNQLNPTALQINCIGFKEIRYIDGSFSAKKLHAYMDFLEKLFPNPVFIVLTRDHNQVLKSGWWQNQDAKLTEAKLNEFEKNISHYMKHKSNIFHIDYSDITGQTQKLKGMFDFIGAPYNKAAIKKVLSTPHSTKTKQDTEYTLQIKQTQHPFVQYVKLDEWPLHKNFQNKGITVSGVLINKADYPQGILIAVNGEHEYPINWKLASPLYKTKFPKNPGAKNARFKIEHLQVSPARPTEIYFQDELANRHLLFKISLEKDI